MAVKTIEWKNDRVIMLDQRLLPHKEVYRVYRDYQGVAEAIRSHGDSWRAGDRRGGGDGCGAGDAQSAGENFRSRVRADHFGIGENPADRCESFLGPRTHAQGLFGKPQPRRRSGTTGAAERSAKNLSRKISRPTNSSANLAPACCAMRSES